MTDHPPPTGGPVDDVPGANPAGTVRADGVEWQRPHPYTLIIEFVSAVRELLVPIVFLLVGGGDRWEGFGLVAIAIPFAAAIAKYYSTRYALTETALLHNHGILRRQKQALPRRNVQNLSTSAGLIARATGLVELTVSDASQGGDVKLRLLSEEEADRLTGLLRATSAPAPAQSHVDHESATSEMPPPEVSLPAGATAGPPTHQTRFGDLIKLTLVNSVGSLLAGLVAFAPVVLGLLASSDVRDLISEEAGLVGVAAIFGIGSVAIAPVTVPLLTFGGFRLWSDPDRLRMKTGLITERQLTARRERIQLVQVNHGLLPRLVRLEAVEFETADVDLGSGARVSALAPAVEWGAWPSLAADALGAVELDENDLRRVSPLTLRRSLVRFSVGSLAFVPIAAALMIAGQRAVAAVVIPVAMLSYAIVAWSYSRRRARRLGWATSEDQILIRTGVIKEKLVLVRKDKIQALRVEQNIFDRRLGLATVRLMTAGLGLRGFLAVPDLDLETADDLLDQLALASAKTPLARTL